MDENQEDGLSEQRIIENYLQEYRLEDVIDEIINQVVITRPTNPYVEIAAAFESRTLPEILDVHLYRLSYYGSYGVKATILTNVGAFSGSAAYNLDISNLNLEPKDFTVLNGKLKELLSPINPQNFKQIEEAILGIPEIDPAESIALGIAALRAAAKFKQVKLHEFIAELASIKEEAICIPVPVPVFATMPVPNTKAIKSIQVFPIRASTFEVTIVKLNQLFNRIFLHEKATKPAKISLYGTTSIEAPTLEDLIKLINLIIQESGEDANFKVGINHQGEQSIKPSDPPAPIPQYFNSAGAVKTGQELVEQLLITWGEVDYISVDSVVAAADLQAMRHLKKRVQEVLFDARNAGNKLLYCSKGVGNDASCNLQVPLEGNFLLTVPVQEMEKQLLELPYNAAKLHLSSVKSISKALEICDRARQLNLPIIIDTSSIFHKNQYSSIDTFEADFAVGVGAVQFYGNGLFDASYNLKLNRLQEIIHENSKIPFVGSKFRTGPEN